MLYTSLSIYIDGIIFLLNPRILTASLTFRSLFLWSLFIYFTIDSYQSGLRGCSFIFLETCSSNDYFTGKKVLFPICLRSLFTPFPSRFRCWLSWKSKKAYFLGLLVFQSPSGNDGSSIYSLKNHPLRICLISTPTSFPPKYLLDILKLFLTI